MSQTEKGKKDVSESLHKFGRKSVRKHKVDETERDKTFTVKVSE